MKHRVTVQSLTRAADGQGGFTEAWVDGATVWAGIKPKKAYERFQAMQLATPITHEITMRYRPDVTSASRLKYGARVFEVKEVINEDEQNRFLTVRAIETESESLVLTIGAIAVRSGGHLLLRDGGKILLRA
ncbi:phage head closure protein [Gemmata sp. G18]|uniref:Phage head closure protein n=2 Tax=Gemmata palustris TaxID=2822762 RepID=A0ABS5BNW7_9BACT|nr:phage head closure protein [Gemmata palustris]